MPNNNKFEPALTYQLKWSVGENKYNDDGKYPKQLSLAVPVDSIIDLSNHLMALRDDSSKVKKGKVWNYEKNIEEEVDVVYINAKGQEGRYGDFGNINPQKIDSEIPF